MPRFTVHSFNTDGTTTSLWMYPDCLDSVRSLVAFRSLLAQQLYTALWEASLGQLPAIRPLCVDFEWDAKARAQDQLFMLGNALLVVSCVTDGATTVDVYLPSETRWFDVYNNVVYVGGQTVSVDAPVGRPLFFVRGGGALFLARRGEAARDKKDLFIVPFHPPQPALRGELASARVYFDDGETTTDRENCVLTVSSDAKQPVVAKSGDAAVGKWIGDVFVADGDRHVPLNAHVTTTQWTQIQLN